MTDAQRMILQRFMDDVNGLHPDEPIVYRRQTMHLRDWCMLPAHIRDLFYTMTPSNQEE